MSIMVVHLVPQGLLFGADRNITSQVERQDGGVAITVEGQSQRPKVLKWPNREAIIGYVGAAETAGMPTDLWLYHSFIGNNLNFSDFPTLAQTLQTELDRQLSSGGLSGPLVIHLGGFEPESGGSRPIVWFIRNTTALTPTGAYVVGTRFDASEELASPAYFGTKPGTEIRSELRAGLYFSFRQGYDLPAFNTIDVKLREAMAIIVHGHPGQTHPVPSDLDEWAKHVRLAVNGYGAYFASFFEPYEQYVGGGADIVYARWP
jgi:hypothetical protein